MDKWNLLLLLLVAAVVVGEDCEQKDGCKCQFSDGSYINLANLFADNTNSRNYLYDTKDNTTIYYHGCVDIAFDVDITNISEDHCRTAASICVFDSDARSMKTLGRSKVGKFGVDEHDGYTLSYMIDGVTTVVALVCTPTFTDNNMDFHNVSKDGEHYMLQLFSQHACRSALPHVISTGTKLIIMFFTFLLVYFIGGVLLAYFIQGTRGRELIPNFEFWTSLPGLVKDGTIFLLSGCSTRLVTTSETYDQI